MICPFGLFRFGYPRKCQNNTRLIAFPPPTSNDGEAVSVPRLCRVCRLWYVLQHLFLFFGLFLHGYLVVAVVVAASIVFVAFVGIVVDFVKDFEIVG